MINNIEIHPSTKIGLIALLLKPIRLFAELYKLLEPQFSLISNSIYTDLYMKERFMWLSDFFLETFQEIYGFNSHNHPHLLEKIKQVIDNEDDSNVLYLSLFKGVADYLALNRKIALRLLAPLRIDRYIITAKPQNPICDALENPQRENLGTDLHDLTDIFKYISVIKDLNLDINIIKNETLNRTCSYLKFRAKNGFKIAVTPFMQQIAFDFDSQLHNWPPTEKTPYWFNKIANLEEAKLWLVEKILQPCLEREVDVLVLPELSIDESLLDFLKSWLRAHNKGSVSPGNPQLLLIVAGSFHFENFDHQRFNMATVLNHSGDILWTQNKLKRFSFDQDDLQKNPALQTLLKTSSAGGYESIYETGAICFADTPIGRISVCICIDFFHKEHLDAYFQAGINVFLVPAMSPYNIRFLQNAGIFARDNLASSFVSNNGYAAKKSGAGIHESGASFYFLPRKGENGVPATGENSHLLIFDINKLIKS